MDSICTGWLRPSYPSASHAECLILETLRNLHHWQPQQLLFFSLFLKSKCTTETETCGRRTSLFLWPTSIYTEEIFLSLLGSELHLILLMHQLFWVRECGAINNNTSETWGRSCAINSNALFGCRRQWSL